jgi:hypothetical protein
MPMDNGHFKGCKQENWGLSNYPPEDLAIGDYPIIWVNF